MPTQTRKKAETEAAAEAAAQEEMEKNKKIVPVIQAKTKVKAGKTKMKSATTQIKAALEEFIELEDASPYDKEDVALTIKTSWKRLQFGKVEIEEGTDNLAKVLGSADPIEVEKAS